MDEIDAMKFDTEVATFAKFQKKIKKSIEEKKEENKEEEEEKGDTIITTQNVENIEEPDRIKLSGDIGQIFEVKELKINMIIIMILLSISSFKFYMIDMQITHELGNIISNTYYNQFSEIAAALVAGMVYISVGPKLSLIMCYGLSIFGTLMLFAYQDND